MRRQDVPLLLPWRHNVALRRFSIVLVVLSVLSSMGAQYRTTNFIVNAQDPQVAKQAGLA